MLVQVQHCKWPIMMSYFCDVGKEQHKHQISVGIAAKANVQSHVLCVCMCVCACVCTQKEALPWEQLPLQWVPHLSVWFQLQSLQMQLTAFVTVMLWRLARHMKLEVAAESGWSGALHSRTETTVGLVVTVVQFFYMIFFF